MKVDSSLELPILDDRPSPSAHWVHFIFSFPGKFQAFSIVVGLNTIIDVPMDGSKLKLSQIILPEGEIPWHNEVDVGFIPLLHLHNPPCAHVLITHGVLLDLRLLTLRAYFLSTLLRKDATAFSKRVLPCWST
jgi:hypothetical protein